MRDWIFAAVLTLACGLIVVGVGLWSLPLALIVAGVLLAALAWLVFVVGEAGKPGVATAVADVDDDEVDPMQVPAYPVPVAVEVDAA